MLIAASVGVAFGATDHKDRTLRADMTAGENPPYAVEDFNYPRADKILEEQGIVLKRGDGHIVLATCGSQEGLLEVQARSKNKVCFRVTGNSGYLTMEIPAVYGVKGNSYETSVKMTVGDREKVYEIAKDSWTNVGEAADPADGDHMLVEISTNK
ncbi:hypothetical protein [Streptomyces macrolidinus]